MNLVLGVSGSIAAYRAADLARELMRAGFTVRVCLTDAAQGFVTPALFEALTGQPCLVAVFEEPDRGRMAHIDWARQADLMVLAPATANTLNKIAHGIGDDMLTTLALAYEGRMVAAPAMNPAMYLNPETQASIEALKARGVVFVEPQEGDVACGENGQGKLASIPAIVAAVRSVAQVGRLWEGKNLLLTMGPTQEPIDDVRFLTNRSSGRMGAALAQAAVWMGANVRVVTGPTGIALPRSAEVVRVRTALEMRQAGLAMASDCDLLIGAAAVADYRPANYTRGKVRRAEAEIVLPLVANPDVLKDLAAAVPPECLKLGFAAEPSEGEEYARGKLERKGLDGIALNDISRADVGFESSDNELALVTRDRPTLKSGKRSKLECALWLLEQAAELASARGFGSGRTPLAQSPDKASPPC
jgi:phosphopantothenoylcysteine decarboxylase/phosphopantothenate--cysteine ligase